MAENTIKYVVDFFKVIQEISRNPQGDQVIKSTTRLIWALVVLVTLPPLIVAIFMMLN